jgi:hypothetical protein
VKIFFKFIKILYIELLNGLNFRINKWQMNRNDKLHFIYNSQFILDFFHCSQQC